MRIASIPLLFFCLCNSFFPSPASAQPREGDFISGTVLDSVHQVPIEYATVMLFSRIDSLRVSGAATDAAGNFKILPVRPGSYFLQISFLGYLPRTLEGLEINRESMRKELGNILLVPTILQGSEVSIIGEKPAVEFHLDKKVINVAKQQNVISGSAVDVLEQVPSVSVDIEGNISLRGSENFMVLVDGRPSILDPNDALQQIPAGTIESIEIITNPSAKYSAEGPAGIINVILNKNRARGISGMVNLNGGLDDKKGGDVLLTKRRDGVTLTLAGDYDDKNFPGETKSVNRTMRDGITSNILSNGSRSHQRTRYGLRGEIEWNPTFRNLLSIGGRVGGMSGERNSDLSYEKWTNTEPHEINSSRSESERSGEFYSMYSYYRHRFAPKGNELTAYLQFNSRESEEKSGNEEFNSANTLVSGQKSTESGPSQGADIKLEYLRELPAEKKLEAGYEGNLDRSEDRNEMAEYDTLQQIYVSQPEFEHKTNYRRNVHAVYAAFGDNSRKLGYQLGLRSEYTDRSIELAGEDRVFTIDRWDYFPSAHLSLNLDKGRQLMTSYSRRIHRARGWQLEPFETWSDAYNVRRGNPSLKPEYIDSYEAGFLTEIWRGSLSLETYYRVTKNRVEFIRSTYSENVTLLTFENVGKDYSLGTECRFDFKLLSWLETGLSGNFYDYRIKGDYGDRSFDNHSFSWNSRLTNTIKIGRSLRWQVDGHYRSSQITSQGEREGFFMTNTSLRKEFLNNNLSMTLQVRDLFGASSRESTASGPDFYEYRKMQRDTPIVMLNINYKFNNYKAKPERSREGDFEEGEEEL